MTLSLFWSRYTLELHDRHIRAIDEMYQYLIAREKWNWFLAKIPEQEQVRILRGHNLGAEAWTCRKWLDHMLEWIKENKPLEDLEKQAAHSLSPEELQRLQQAGYFQWLKKQEP